METETITQDVVKVDFVSDQHFHHHDGVSTMHLFHMQGHHFIQQQQPMLIMSETSSASGSSSAETTPKRRKRRRRRRRRRKRGGRVTPQLQEPEISDEEKAKYIAMDCEMVGVGIHGTKSAVARVCLVNWDGETVLDLYVLPDEPVRDYRTFVSGITEEDLMSDDVVNVDECRAIVAKMIHGKVLVGHGLKSDLRSLGMTHPWQDIRDTGKYEPFMKVRFSDGVLWPRKLKDLAKERLNIDIQQYGQEHCPEEDAETAMQLYKLVRRKWDKVMNYKHQRTLEIQRNQSS